MKFTPYRTERLLTICVFLFFIPIILAEIDDNSRRSSRLRETRRSYFRKRKLTTNKNTFPKYVVRQRNTASSCRQFCESSISQLQRQLSQNIGHRQNVKIELERCMNQKRTSVRNSIILSEKYKRNNKTLYYCKADLARKNLKIKDQYNIIIELQDDIRKLESELQAKTEQCGYDLDSMNHKCKYDLDASKHRCQDQIQQYKHKQQMCEWDLEQMTLRSDELEGVLKNYAEMLRNGDVGVDGGGD